MHPKWIHKSSGGFRRVCNLLILCQTRAKLHAFLYRAWNQLVVMSSQRKFAKINTSLVGYLGFGRWQIFIASSNCRFPKEWTYYKIKINRRAISLQSAKRWSMKFENHEEMYNSLPWDPFDGLWNAFRMNFHPRHHDQEYIFLHRFHSIVQFSI